MPGPGVVVALVALVAALGGTAVALPGKNTVDSGDVKANAIKASDIAAGAVGGSEVKEATLSMVPSARRADTAARADRATAADTAANAHALGGKSAAQLDTRWALIGETGEIERQTGGFAIVDCYQTNANCYISAGEDVRDNGIQAQIVIANTDGSSILSGETGTAPCGTSFVACAPPNTEANDVLVVAPRASDGAVPGGVTPPAPADAARFYVFVTGSQG
jgi:hypothetical protein